MTLPPIDPAGREPLADASPTEPVPVPTPPPGAPTFAAPGGLEPSPVFAAPEGPAPSPAHGTGTPPPARGGGSSRIINVALGAAILVGAAGIAFAAGRATSPASTTANVPAASSGLQGGIGANGNGGPDRPGDLDGGRGFGRVGFGGLGLSGTVTAATSDSITLQTDAGQVITFSLVGTTTYHQQADASASDVKTGSKVQVTPSGRIEPTQGANGEIDLGAAGSITIVP